MSYADSDLFMFWEELLVNKFSKVLLAVIVGLIGSMSIDTDKVHAMTQKDLAGMTYLIEEKDADGESEENGNNRFAVIFSPKGDKFISTPVQTDGNGTITKPIDSKTIEDAQKGGKDLKKVEKLVSDGFYKVHHGKKKDTILIPRSDTPSKIKGNADKFSTKFKDKDDGDKYIYEFTLAKNPYQFNW